jgi:hypothetical protein
VAPVHAGQLLFTCAALRVNEGDVTLSLSDTVLTEAGPRGKLYVHLDFDIKFSFQSSPPLLSFEKGEERHAYKLKS